MEYLMRHNAKKDVCDRCFKKMLNYHKFKLALSVTYKINRYPSQLSECAYFLSKEACCGEALSCLL